jgi:hypothetical protein
MVKAKSQFKRRSTANNVEVVIPVPSDADSPKFKTTIGKYCTTFGLAPIVEVRLRDGMILNAKYLKV